MRQGLVATAVGTAFGVVGAVVVLPALRAAITTAEPLSWPSVAAVLVTLATVAVVACAVPALRASQVDPMRVLKS